MYIPENPLIDDTWLKTGRISYHAGFDESFTQHYREPCIVFAGHPSLRAGEATHFVRRWGQNTNNAIVFTGKFTISIYEHIFMSRRSFSGSSFSTGTIWSSTSANHSLPY
jgi:hypothetical protein